MANMILGAFPNRGEANAVVTELERLGISRDNMSIIFKADEVEPENFGQTVTETATKGATTGGAIGGLAGLLAGAIPAAGFFFFGPIAAALGLTGIAATTLAGAATGVLAGGLVGALIGMGVPRGVAEEYERALGQDGVVLGVLEGFRTLAEIKNIFKQHNAEQISVIEYNPEQ